MKAALLYSKLFFWPWARDYLAQLLMRQLHFPEIATPIYILFCVGSEIGRSLVVLYSGGLFMPLCAYVENVIYQAGSLVDAFCWHSLAFAIPFF